MSLPGVLLVLMVQISYFVAMATIHKPGNLPKVAFIHPGDYKIGAILSVHITSPDKMCGDRIREFAVYQNLESIAFAVDEINGRNDLLPNRTLGFVILDDCSKATSSLTRALHFVQTPSPSGGASSSEMSHGKFKDYDVIGLIGPESSANAVQTADLLSLFKVPQISYISTSPLLSNKRVFPYFSRIVPSDKLQVEVLVDLVTYFNWTYVSIVYEEGSYGAEFNKAFKNLAEKQGICMGISLIVRGYLTDKTADKVVQDLLTVPRARAVVLVVSNKNMATLFRSVTRLGRVGYFRWLGSDAWGGNVQDFTGIEDVGQGSLTIGFQSRFVNRFDNSLKYLTATNGSYNPWFFEFFENRYNCKFYPGINDKLCDRNKSFEADYSPLWTSSLVIDAVYTYAYALHDVIQGCKGAANEKKCVEPEKMLKAIRNLTFEGEHGPVSFDEFGDGSATYTVRTLRRVNDGYSLDEIALWDTNIRSFTYFNPDLITWPPASVSSNRFLVSTCSDPCDPGYQAVTTQPHCCWYCEECNINEITLFKNDTATCEVCPKGGVFEWPDPTRTKCLPIAINVLSMPGSAGTVISALLLLVIVGTFIIIAILMRNIESLVLETSSEELSFLMLMGIIASNILTFSAVVPPTQGSCNLVVGAFQLSFTFTYGPFLVKTNRIYRIQKAQLLNMEAKFTGALPSIIFTFMIYFTQIVILVVSAHFDPPEPLTVMWSPYVNYVESACQLGHYGFLSSLTFNLVLLLLCAYHAIKGRNVKDIDTTHENKFINICVYTSIVLWLGFPACYFTSDKLIVQSIIICIASITNSVIFLCLLFGSKVYTLYNPIPENSVGQQPPARPATATETLNTLDLRRASFDDNTAQLTTSNM
ncbi:metabotropic glutamate receptor 4 [Patella vulgata]|uniref:metabotropic glutamate receptor 4 n=1 Tax=Patella vulgata TaxID=6465 RepID=UPI00217FDEA7|nr:metabotropic glutamate receptor 4 [Patella vulgata]